MHSPLLRLLIGIEEALVPACSLTIMLSAAKADNPYLAYTKETEKHDSFHTHF